MLIAEIVDVALDGASFPSDSEPDRDQQNRELGAVVLGTRRIEAARAVPSPANVRSSLVRQPIKMLMHPEGERHRANAFLTEPCAS